MSISFPDHDIPNVIINGWAADSPLFDELKIRPGGRLLKADDHHKVLVGSVLAGNLNVKVGDKIPLYGESVEVVGIFDSKQVYESGSIVALLSDMQQYMIRPGQVTGFMVRAKVAKDATTGAEVGSIGRAAQADRRP